MTSRACEHHKSAPLPHLFGCGVEGLLDFRAGVQLMQRRSGKATFGEPQRRHGRVGQVALVHPQALEQYLERRLETRRLMQLRAHHAAHQAQRIDRKPRWQPERHALAFGKARKVDKHVAPFGRHHRR